jgi:2-keto-4-pentenoate hydratase
MLDIDAIAGSFHAALHANRPYQPPSAQRPLAMAEALAVQRAFNALRAGTDPVAGYKAALTDEGPQRALGLTGPISGALFASRARQPGAVVDRAAFRGLLIETELGFRAARRIDRPVDGRAELRAAIATVSPMFELADPGFGRVALTGTDLVAANAACGEFVEGVPRPAAEADVNAVTVRLLLDGNTLHEVCAGALVGDQWRALHWLVNAVVAAGEVVEAGQLLMTGALGGAHPALPGRYRAEFGVLGDLEITVR